MAIVIEHAPARLTAGAAIGVGNRQRLLEDRDEAYRQDHLSIDRANVDLRGREFGQRVREYDEGRSDAQAAYEEARALEERERADTAAALGTPLPGILGYIQRAMGQGPEAAAARLPARSQFEVLDHRQRQQQRETAEQEAQQFLRRGTDLIRMGLRDQTIDETTAQGLAMQLQTGGARAFPGVQKFLLDARQQAIGRQRQAEQAAAVVPLVQSVLGPEEAAVAQHGLESGQLSLKDLLTFMLKRMDGPDAAAFSGAVGRAFPNADPGVAQGVGELAAMGYRPDLPEVSVSGESREQPVTKRPEYTAIKERIANLEAVAKDEDTPEKERKQLKGEIRDLRRQADKMLAGSGAGGVRVIRDTPNAQGFLELEVAGQRMEVSPQHLARLTAQLEQQTGLSDAEKEAVLVRMLMGGR
jgi:hypothetical protein